jgi:RNA polymerase sigma-70 factor (ECF subfamily)
MANPHPAATLAATQSLTMTLDTDDVTGMMRALQSGEPASADRLLTVLYDELRRLARTHLRRERREHTLNATSLVHEAYLRLVKHRHHNWQSRAHFFGAASTAMRRVLVDHARGRLALKRGAAVRVGLTGCEPIDTSAAVLDEVIAIDAALDRLAEIDERLARIVDCRYFAGLTIEETAEAIGVSHTTVSDGWRFARAWLERALRSGLPAAPDSGAERDASARDTSDRDTSDRSPQRGSRRASERTTEGPAERTSNRESSPRWRGWGSAA